MKVGESVIDQAISMVGMTKGKVIEKEEIITGSLTERANNLMNDAKYKSKLEKIKKGEANCRFMDFIMDGKKICVPYNGQKVTSGYLKKET